MAKQELTFILNKNLGFPITEEPWTSIFSAAGIKAEATTNLAKVEQMLTEGGPNIAYVPGAGFCVMLRKGNQHYRGLVIATSKFTGQAAQHTLLVVRQDDPARSLDDLEGSEYGYLNRTCSSSFFPPAILQAQTGSWMAGPSGCRRRQVGSCNDDSRRRMENDTEEHRVGENHWRIFSMCTRDPHRTEGSCSGGREHNPRTSPKLRA
jgi:ABC-type phosphate/phosphonate transport system substrate-binding protein